MHAGGKLGVLVALATRPRGEPARALAKDLAMHVAAADPSPVAVDRGGVPAELLERERELYRKQAEQERQARDGDREDRRGARRASSTRRSACSSSPS